MTKINQPEESTMRVLRVSHASLTPALRERERALVRCYRNVDLEVVTTDRWREAEVDVEAVDDDLFPATLARARPSNPVPLFAYHPRPLVASLSPHTPDVLHLH